MKLYEIDEQIRQIESALMETVDEDTGEITDGLMANLLMDRLTDLDIAREKKIEGICLWRLETLGEAEAIGNEIKRLQKRKKAAENRAESLKQFVTEALNGEKFKTPKVSVSYKKSESVSVPNPAALPDDYVRIKLEPDKAKIKDAIKKGEEVYGATLETNVSTIIK